MESRKPDTSPTKEELKTDVVGDGYAELSALVDSKESVDIATLDSYLEANKITHQQYIELSRKLLKRHEHIQEGLVHAADKLETERTRLETERGTDILTGLYNRLFLHHHLEKLITELNIEEKRHPERKAVVVVKFDLKGLSEKNADGHDEVGDKFLKDFADTLNTKIARRGNDMSFRVGGDEFTVLLSIEDGDMDEDQVEDVIQKVLESIRSKVSDIAYIGYTALKKGEKIGTEELLKRADQDLVKNKAQEKNLDRFQEVVRPAIYEDIRQEILSGDYEGSKKDLDISFSDGLINMDEYDKLMNLLNLYEHKTPKEN